MGSRERSNSIVETLISFHFFSTLYSLDIELRASCMLSKHTAAELQSCFRNHGFSAEMGELAQERDRKYLNKCDLYVLISLLFILLPG